jgi:hypothetical protein
MSDHKSRFYLVNQFVFLLFRNAGSFERKDFKKFRIPHIHASVIKVILLPASIGLLLLRCCAKAIGYKALDIIRNKPMNINKHSDM